MGQKGTAWEARTNLPKTDKTDNQRNVRSATWSKPLGRKNLEGNRGPSQTIKQNSVKYRHHPVGVIKHTEVSQQMRL